MLTPSITSTPAAAIQSQSTPQNDLGQKDVFLQLLVAQMQYQDPMKPQDPTQMSSQLAQFNMVDQQTQTNTLLQQLVDGNGSQQNVGATSGSGASYLGHTVTVSQNEIYFDGTTQNAIVNLSSPAAQATVYIMDSNGTPIKTFTLNNLPQGTSQLTWDGSTDSGATAAIGNYQIQVSSVDANGSTVTNSIQRSGIVDAVRFTSNGTELVVGGIPTTLDKITELR